MSPCEKFVGNDAQRIDVIRWRRGQVVEHLGAGIGRGISAEILRIEKRIIGFRLQRRRHGARNAEIEHLDFVIVIDEYVARFEIRVHDAFLVRKRKRSCATIEN